MLKLIKYELIKQKTSKVIIGAILALLEVVFLAGMLLGKEEIMAIAAGMLTFLASVTFVIVGLEEIRNQKKFLIISRPGRNITQNTKSRNGMKIISIFIAVSMYGKLIM